MILPDKKVRDPLTAQPRKAIKKNPSELAHELKAFYSKPVNHKPNISVDV